MAKCDAVTVVGAGWIGGSLGERFDVVPRPRRSFVPEDIVSGSAVIVASGRPALSSADGFGAALSLELGHLRRVLDACQRARARRVVVLGSSDVAGLAERVVGASAQAPITRYAQVKAALEDECVLRADAGMPITTVRLAPVHGAGKARTASLIRLVRRPVVPLPGGGGHSIGFVLLDDAIRAIEWLGGHPAPPVVAIGAGPTPLRKLLEQLAIARGARPRFVTVPVPASGLRKVAPLPMPGPLYWLLRLSLPRVVEMEVPVPVTPLPQAAAMLVASC